jgi:hypothetical protein
MARVGRAGRARLSPSFASVAVLVSAVCSVRLARAEPPQNGVPVWLSGYRADATCPDVGAFVGAVQRRRSSPAAKAGEHIRVGVEIESRAAAVYTGAIDVSDGAEHTRRVVAGADCAEVSEALSLIAAMGLDTGARSHRVEDTRDAASARTPENDGGAARAPAPSRDEGLALGFGALVVANGAASPGAALGLGGALALEWSAGAWQPALLVSAFRATGDDVSFAQGTARARFELLAGAAQLCPLRFPAYGRWALRPCLELELGQLSGTSSGAAVRGATTRSGLWSSANVGARGDAELWGPLRISASVAAVVPLARHEYSFSPDATTAFRVPALSLRVAGLVGVLF